MVSVGSLYFWICTFECHLTKTRFRDSNGQILGRGKSYKKKKKEPPQFCSHAGLNKCQAFPLMQSWMELCQAHNQRLSAWLPPRDWYAAE